MRDKRIRLADFGTSFATRDRAKNLAQELFGGLRQSVTSIDLDCGGVVVVSYSFADQLVGELISLMGSRSVRRVTFSDCNDELTQVLIHVIERRLRLAPAPPEPSFDDGLIALTASAA